MVDLADLIKRLGEEEAFEILREHVEQKKPGEEGRINDSRQ